jgi:hypothetical protein
MPEHVLLALVREGDGSTDLLGRESVPLERHRCRQSVSELRLQVLHIHAVLGTLGAGHTG